ncbi:hypothetical protein [Flavobacterium laiguense]|uniref:hypothetical protein n=1 Tax=Flavobacterium laiguense TaxID=2169409 RepID=UPI0016713D70|nr:hypothetical protein [Flavobacterium laiguense]
MKDWKTTLAGVIVGGVAVAIALGYISAEVGAQIIAVAGALGLIAAKDGDKTGIAK